ncbi:MAG: DUF4328 domain-containing protein, partial [Pseudomonadota bacterium]
MVSVMSPSARGTALRVKEGYPKPTAPVAEIIKGALWVQLAVHGATFALETGALMMGQPKIGTELPFLRDVYQASFFVYFLAALMGCVAWFHWLDRMVKNIYADGVTNLNRTPLDVVLNYMTPGLNLWKPLQDFQAIYRALWAKNEWTEKPPSPLLTFWWGVSIAQLILMGIENIVGLSWVTSLSSV